MPTCTPRPPLIGSLCSGYGGLDLGVQAALGGTLAWHAEINPDAARILARHWPGVPNLGDITAINWADVPAGVRADGGLPLSKTSPSPAAAPDSTPTPARGCGCTSPVRSKPSAPAWS